MMRSRASRRAMFASSSSTMGWMTRTLTVCMGLETRLGCGARGSEATLGLGIQSWWERPLPQGGDIILEMRRVDRSHDGRGHARVGEGEAKDELHRGHALEQVIESCLLPALPLRP